MEEFKKRGRKKKIQEEVKEQEEVKDQEVVKEQEVVVHKKRGRKKKWETTPFKNNFFGETAEVIKFDDNNSVMDESSYNTNKVKFGNLFIKIHDKEPEQKPSFFEETTEKKECLLNLSSDDEEPILHKESNKKKSVVVYNKEVSKARCFNCHNFFDNSPFYLPFDHCPTLDRYKIYGNFCSPNCVKTFSNNSRHFQNKQHLVGQFYRKLFGADFRIKPAPSCLTLKDYGGDLTIEEYRASFYKNKRYTLSNINCKIVKEEIISSK